MIEVRPVCYESLKRMHQAGTKIFMGTDIQFDPEMGSNATELELYVKLGMSTMEAIQTATKNAAEAMKLQKKDNIRMVMKEGKAYIDKLRAKPLYVIHPEPGYIRLADS